jgi:serine/threonine-protein phosphatase 2A activator
MIDWVDEVPPLPQENQRFGNRAFRNYIELVEKVSRLCLKEPGTGH